MEKEAPVKSVQKALALLDAIVLSDFSGDGKSLKELAAVYGLPVNTAHNLLKSLEICGYVRKSGRGLYAVGEKCLEMARVSLASRPESREALMPVLQRYVEEIGEAIVCTVLYRGDRVTVGKIDSNQAIRVSHSMVEQTPFFSKPTGRVLAAMASPAQLREIIKRHGFPDGAWDHVDSEDVLGEALGEVKKRGMSMTEEDELLAIAIPLNLPDGSPWGALGSYAPAFRCDDEKREAMLEALRRTAERLSRRIASL